MYKLPFQSQQNISIQQQLGEAFQDVKTVRDNLDNIVAVVELDQDNIANVASQKEAVLNVSTNMSKVLTTEANLVGINTVSDNINNVNTVGNNLGTIENTLDNLSVIQTASDFIDDTEVLLNQATGLITFGTEQYGYIDLVLGDKYVYGDVFNQADLYDDLLGKVYEGTATPEELAMVDNLDSLFGVIAGAAV